MDIQKKLDELDRLSGARKTEEMRRLLSESVEQARKEGDEESLVTLLNEKIRFHSDRGELDACFECCDQVKKLMEDMGLEQSVAYAGTLMNIASACRAAGRTQQCRELYRKAEEIYGRRLDKDDNLYASLYNSMGLFAEQEGRTDEAEGYLKKALEIMIDYPERETEAAEIRANLASVLLKAGRPDEAAVQLDKAMKVFESQGGESPGSRRALAGLSEYYYQKGEYGKAEQPLKRAMLLQETCFGNDNGVYAQFAADLRKIRRAAEMYISCAGSEEADNCGGSAESGNDGERGEAVRRLWQEKGQTAAEELTDDIIALEWRAFEEAGSMGGLSGYTKADRETFRIMRKSLYLSWPEKLLRKYEEDFAASLMCGRDMVTEKYARMMEYTAPEIYASIKDRLPEISDGKRILVEAVVVIQVQWMEEVFRRNPRLAGNYTDVALGSEKDSADTASYETYLRCELSTYSEDMLRMYFAYVVELKKEGINLCERMLKYTRALSAGLPRSV